MTKQLEVAPGLTRQRPAVGPSPRGHARPPAYVSAAVDVPSADGAARGAAADPNPEGAKSSSPSRLDPVALERRLAIERSRLDELEGMRLRNYRVRRMREMWAATVLAVADTALHEAWHTIAAYDLWLPIHEVTLDPTRTMGAGQLFLGYGDCILEHGCATETALWTTLCVGIAGPSGQALACDRHAWTGQSDRYCHEIASRLYPDQPPAAPCQVWFERIQELQMERAHLVAAQVLAEALRERETLSGEAVTQILGEHLPSRGEWLPQLQRLHDELSAASRETAA